MQQQLELFIEEMDNKGILYSEAVTEFKKRYIIHILTKNSGNQCKAAKDMNMHRNTLSRTVAELKIDVNETKKSVRSSYVRQTDTSSYSESAEG